MYQSIGRGHQPRIVSKWKATLQAVLLQSGLTFMGLMLLVPPAYGQPTAVANFHTISLYYTRAKATSVTIRYRPSGTTLWKSAQPMWWDGTATRTAERNQYRSSLVNLSPGTTYNIQYRVDSGSWTSIPDVHTRSDTFPSSGNTVSYTGQTLRSLSITTGGSAANWRIYDGGGTASIDANHAGANACVTIGASYVILRNFTVTDCKFSAVAITRSNVVIENNIISDWGAREVDVPSRVGPSGLRLNDAAATCIAGVSKADFGRSSDHGIVVNGAGLSGIVIQRNTIRDPRFRATRWNECPSWDAHPQGPRAIYFATGTVNYGKGNVIRYNDIHATNTTSSGGGVILSRPANRFHDIIGVGYQKDLDVYGNIIRNAVDDAVEADGSAVNVRIWGNYFDLSLTAVSHQRMDAGPSYIFRNIIDRGADGWTGSPGNNYVVIPGENMTVLGNRAWKLSVDNGSAAEAVFNGPVYLFHNTQLRTTNDGPGHCYFIPNKPNKFHGLPIKNVISQNNVCMSALRYIDDELNDTTNYTGYYFGDMHNRSNYSPGITYTMSAGDIMATATWKSGHGPTRAWVPPPATPTGKYMVSNAGTGIAISNFNDLSSLGRGAHQYNASADNPMTFGRSASWTYVPSN